MHYGRQVAPKVLKLSGINPLQKTYGVKTMRLHLAILMVALLSVPVFAQQAELPSPGITPDSALYGLDKAFDFLQSSESLADERAAEVKAMAEKNNDKALEAALSGYEKAMAKREADSAEDAESAEQVVKQAAKHLEVLARVREQVPEQARQGIDRALARGANGAEHAMGKLKEKDPARAESVAQETLARVLEKAPEAAKQGLQRAIEASGRRGPPQGAPGERGQEAGQQETSPTNKEAAQANKPESTGKADQMTDKMESDLAEIDEMSEDLSEDSMGDSAADAMDDASDMASSKGKGKN